MRPSRAPLSLLPSKVTFSPTPKTSTPAVATDSAVSRSAQRRSLTPSARTPAHSSGTPCSRISPRLTSPTVVPRPSPAAPGRPPRCPHWAVVPILFSGLRTQPPERASQWDSTLIPPHEADPADQALPTPPRAPCSGHRSPCQPHASRAPNVLNSCHPRVFALAVCPSRVRLYPPFHGLLLPFGLRSSVTARESFRDLEPPPWPRLRALVLFHSPASCVSTPSRPFHALPFSPPLHTALLSGIGACCRAPPPAPQNVTPHLPGPLEHSLSAVGRGTPWARKGARHE